MKKYYIVFDNAEKIESILISIDEDKNASLPIHPPGHIRPSCRFSIDSKHKVNIYFKNNDPGFNDFEGKYDWIKLIDLKELAFDHGSILCQSIGAMWRNMPSCLIDSKKEVSLPEFLQKQINFNSVVFYGGSFNPWHEGHMACVNLCPNQNIIIVPDYNPWKEKDQGGVTQECRWKSIRRLALSLKETPYSIYPGFWGVSTPNPTSGWLPSTGYENKSLLLGADSFLSFGNWKDVDKIIDSIDILYVTPRGSLMDEIVNSKKEFDFKYSSKSIEVIILKDHPYKTFSSTKIRNESK